MSVARFEGDPEVEYERLLVRAKSYTKVVGLKPQLRDNPEAIRAIMWSLRAYGMEPTIPAVNMSFDWIGDEATPSAMFYTAVGRQNRYRITPRTRSRDLAVAHVTKPSDPYDDPFDVEFDLQDAIDAHRLDEWVERWPEKRRDGIQPPPERAVVRVNGQGVMAPEWAAQLVETQPWRIKRYDAWWNYRRDMLWKSAAKRAVKIACPHVLLGGSDAEGAWVPPPGVGEVTAEQDPIDVDGEDIGSEAEPEYGPDEEPFE